MTFHIILLPLAQKDNTKGHFNCILDLWNEDFTHSNSFIFFKATFFPLPSRFTISFCLQRKNETCYPISFPCVLIFGVLLSETARQYMENKANNIAARPAAQVLATRGQHPALGVRWVHPEDSKYDHRCSHVVAWYWSTHGITWNGNFYNIGMPPKCAVSAGGELCWSLAMFVGWKAWCGPSTAYWEGMWDTWHSWGCWVVHSLTSWAYGCPPAILWKCIDLTTSSNNISVGRIHSPPLKCWWSTSILCLMEERDAFHCSEVPMVA